MDLKGRSFLKLLDFTPEEITDLLSSRQRKRRAFPTKCMRGRTSP